MGEGEVDQIWVSTFYDEVLGFMWNNTENALVP